MRRAHLKMFSLALLALLLSACGSSSTVASSASVNAAAAPATPTAPSEPAPPPSTTGGFDGQQAYDYTAKLVAFGPRPPASDAIHRTQDYLLAQLKSFGCAVDTDDFHSQTPIGDVTMKNIVAKVPGTGPGVILLLTHYDTLRLNNFVGAVDGGSSTGLILELARILCGSHEKQTNSVWMAFLDGEEAQLVENGVAQWTSSDSVYGSRELAARLALSGDLQRIRAVMLADMIGPNDLRIEKDSNSTPWLSALVWSTAARLGYGNIFVSQSTAVDDDHMPFIHRDVPSVDVIDLNDYRYWHTAQDTMDKVSPRSLAVVGHVFLASVSELQNKFH